jgi:archaellum component FlaC
MSANDSDSFRLGTLDDTGEIAPPVNDVELFELQLKKVKRRLRWFMFLLILLVAILFSAGYVDLKNRFSMQTNSGIREIENISTVFEDRFNELQKRIDDVGNSLSQEMTALDQKTVVSQKDLAALRQTIEKLDVSGVVEKKQKAILQEVRKEVAPLDQRIKSLQSELAVLDKKLQSQLQPLSESLASNTQRIEALKNRIGPLSGEIVNRDMLDLELLKLRKAYRQSMTEEISGLDKQLRLLSEKVERLERRLASGIAPAGSSGAPSGSAPPSTGNTTGIQEQPLP